MRGLPTRRTNRIVLWAILILAAVITWAPLHSLDDEARVIDRTPGGDWVWKGKSPVGFGLRAARTTGTTDSSINSFVPASAGPFACERVWILARSQGRLTQKVGLALQEALLADPVLTELAYFPLSDQPLAVERPPDLYVTLEVLRRREVQFPGYQYLEFDLRWCVGRRPFHAQLTTKLSDGRSPYATGTVLRSEKSWGLVSSAANYDEAAAAVLGAIDLPARIATWREDLGTLPSVPLEHAGASHEPADLPFLDEPGLDRLYSATPFLTHGEDAWTLPCDDPLARLGLLLTSLEREGWSVVDQTPRVLCMTRSARYLEVQCPVPGEDGGYSQSLALFHQDRFSAAEIRAFFEARVSAGDGPEELALLAQHMLRSDREELKRALEDTPEPVRAALAEALQVLR